MPIGQWDCWVLCCCLAFFFISVSSAQTRKGTKEHTARFCPLFAIDLYSNRRSVLYAFLFSLEKFIQLTFLRQNLFQSCNCSWFLWVFNFAKWSCIVFGNFLLQLRVSLKSWIWNCLKRGKRKKQNKLLSVTTEKESFTRNTFSWKQSYLSIEWDISWSFVLVSVFQRFSIKLTI